MAVLAQTPLSPEDREMWEGRLKEAQNAYHELATGQAVASFTDQNGERVTYAKADANKVLPGYIADMIALLGTPTTVRTAVSPRPLRFYFGA